jgi:triosephosphate isomerase (TIM)
MLIAGNWKMHMDLASARQLASAVVSAVGDPGGVDVAVCPPYVSLDATFGVLHGSKVRMGAQNMHEAESGAYTGEISASMLRAVGCHYVILGHSERRLYYGETDEGVCAKISSALAHRLVPIVCVGESLEERDQGVEQEVVGKQLKNALGSIELSDSSDLVVAYEPIWAIGTGRTATPEQAQLMHAVIRAILKEIFGKEVGTGISILYGGSMKPGNAPELLQQPDIDGGLIGGASLKSDDFSMIVRAAREVPGS